MKRAIGAALVAVVVAFGLAACGSPADTVAHNLSKDAEAFQVNRRIVFFNGITDKYLLTIEGYCSVETGDSLLAGSLEVTCMTGPNQYKKSFLGLSDNVSYFVEQIDSIKADPYHYKVFFRPTTIVPDIDVN